MYTFSNRQVLVCRAQRQRSKCYTWTSTSALHVHGYLIMHGLSPTTLFVPLLLVVCYYVTVLTQFQVQFVLSIAIATRLDLEVVNAIKGQIVESVQVNLSQCGIEGNAHELRRILTQVICSVRIRERKLIRNHQLQG